MVTGGACEGMGAPRGSEDCQQGVICYGDRGKKSVYFCQQAMRRRLHRSMSEKAMGDGDSPVQQLQEGADTRDPNHDVHIGIAEPSWADR